MSFRPRDIKNIIISGIFISILTIILMASIFVLGKENSFFEPKSLIYSHVKNAQNLKAGTAVKYKGIKIGKVQSISILAQEIIQIEISISSKYLKWIKIDSIVNIKTQGVLGDKYLEITGGTLGTHSIKHRGKLKVIESSQFDKIIDRGENITTILSRVLLKVDKIIGHIDDKDLSQTLSEFSIMTKSVNNLLNKLNNIEIQKISKNVDTGLSSLTRITKRIENGPGNLHSIIYDLDLHQDLKILLGGANRNKVLKYFIRESLQEKK